MGEALRRSLRVAAVGTLAGIAGLLVMMQAVFAVVVGGEAWVDHTHGVRLQAERLATAVAEGGAGRARALALADHLAWLVRDNPAQAARAEALRPLLAANTPTRAADVAAALAAIQAVEAELLARREGRVQVLRVVFAFGGVAMGAMLAWLLWRQYRLAAGQAAEEEQARLRLEALLDEKLRLLKEVNHRVGNSLAMVGALLHVQTRGAADGAAKSALEEARARVNAVGKVHQRIMNAGTVDTLDLAQHLPALCDELGASLGQDGQLVGRVAGDAVVPVETGVALSLLVNELATPALLARPAEGHGAPVRVYVRPGEGSLLVTVTDPAGSLPAASGGDEVRAMVLSALVAQLGAVVANDAGREVTLRVADPT